MGSLSLVAPGKSLEPKRLNHSDLDFILVLSGYKMREVKMKRKVASELIKTNKIHPIDSLVVY